MQERDTPRMQGDSSTPEANGGVLSARVLPFPDERKPGVREVDSDLVVAARDEIDLDARRRAEGFERSIAGRGLLAARRDARERTLLEDRELERALRRTDATLRERPVGLAHGALAKRLLETRPRLLVEREQGRTRDLAVESVH